MACLIASGLLGAARLGWDAAAAHEFAGLASRVAGFRAAGRHAQALSLIAGGASRFPGTNFASALGSLEQDVVAEMIAAERRTLREAARLEGEGRAGDAYRLYGDLEKTAQVEAVRVFAERSRARITSRREAAEAVLNQAREREGKGDLAGASLVYRRVLREHPGSSAARDLKVPLSIETEPPGARMFVAGRGPMPAPAWILWPARPGARLRVEKEGFRPVELRDLVSAGPTSDDRVSFRISLEPEPLLEVPRVGGAFAGGSLFDLAVTLGADGVLRGLRPPSASGEGGIAWETPLDAASAPAAGAGAFVGTEVVVLRARGGPFRAFARESGRERGVDGEAAFLERALAFLPAAELARRAAADRGRVYTLLHGGTLERWDPGAVRPAFSVRLGDALDRVSAGGEAIIVTGASGRRVAVDPVTGAVRSEARLSLPAEPGLVVEEVIPLGGSGDLVVRARQAGAETLLARSAEGVTLWRFRTGSENELSVRPPGAAWGQGKVLVTAAGFGVQLLRVR